MAELYISFYLNSNRIHIFIDSLRVIGSPKRICFLLSQSGGSLLISPHAKRDLVSHKVPNDVYSGCDSMEVHSMQFCRIIAEIHNWDLSRSYRAPGSVFPDMNAVAFDLTKAKIIDHGT